MCGYQVDRIFSETLVNALGKCYAVVCIPLRYSLIMKYTTMLNVSTPALKCHHILQQNRQECSYPAADSSSFQILSGTFSR